MKKANIKWSFFILLAIIFIIAFSLILTSCASTDPRDAHLYIRDDNFYYNSSANVTKVNFQVSFENNSIYKIVKNSITFDLYDNGKFVFQNSFNWDINIKPYSTLTKELSFSVNGKVDRLEVLNWEIVNASIWQSYKAYFITIIVIISILLVVYAIVQLGYNINEGCDPEDSFAVIIWILTSGWWSFLIAIGVAILPYLIYSGVWKTWSWVPPIIIVGGVVVLIAACFLVSFIYFIIFAIHNRRVENQAISYDCDEVMNKYTKNQLNQVYKHVFLDICKASEFKVDENIKKEELINLILSRRPDFKESDNTKNLSKPNNNEIKPLLKSPPSKKPMFEDIVGLNKAKEAFIEKIILPFKHKEIFEKFNKKIGGGILLYGLPGTGKTMFAEATSNELNALFIPIKCSDIKTKWYGESEQRIHKIFERARKQEKAIIFFDEFEAIGTKRMDNAISEGNDIVPQLLSEMQGIDNLKNESNIIVIAATNKPWMIDSAFLRPGRFDEKIYIPLPDYESRKKMFEIQLSSLPIADNFDFDYLASITENFNGADIKEVCEKIKMSAIKKNINNNQEHKIEMEDVKQIEKDIKSSVNLQDIQKLKEFEKNFY